MKLRETFVLMGILTVGMVATVYASDSTQASALMDEVGQWVSAWLGRAMIIGFAAAIIGAVLQHFFSVSQLMGVPVYYIIIIGIITGVGTMVAQAAAAFGATVH